MDRSLRYILIVSIIVVISVVGILHVSHQDNESNRYEDFNQDFNINQYDGDNQILLNNNTFFRALYDYEKSRQNLVAKNDSLDTSLKNDSYTKKVNAFDTAVNTLHDASTKYKEVNEIDYQNIQRESEAIRKKITDEVYRIQQRKADLLREKQGKVDGILSNPTYTTGTVIPAYRNILDESSKIIEKTLSEGFENPAIEQAVKNAYNQNLQTIQTVLSYPSVDGILNAYTVNPYVVNEVETAVSAPARPNEPTTGVMTSVYSTYDNQKIVNFRGIRLNYSSSNETDALFPIQIDKTVYSQRRDARLLIAFEGYILIPSDVSSVRIQVCSSYLKSVAWSVNRTIPKRKNEFIRYVAWSKDFTKEPLSSSNNPFGRRDLEVEQPSMLCYTSDPISVAGGK